MKNLTLALEDELLERARGLAANRHTSLNALIRSLLAHELDQDDRMAQAKVGMKKLMEEAANKSDGAEAPYEWDRLDAYREREDRMLSRHEHPDLRGFGEKS